MSIQIIRRNPITHSIKIALLTIGLFVLLGLVLRFTDRRNSKEGQSSEQLKTSEGNIPTTLLQENFLVPIIDLHVTDTQFEVNWSKALTSTLNGTSESEVAFGRVDVLTQEYAIEVDRIEKWQEGIGQALHYSKASEKRPCLALIAEPAHWPLDSQLISKLQYIDKLCMEQGIKLILLRNSENNSL